MSRKIYKYPFNTTDFFMLDMPIGSKIISVQTQSEKPCIWAMVDTEAEKERRRFTVIGTGNPIDDELQLAPIGTYQLSNGALVFHLFEII